MTALRPDRAGLAWVKSLYGSLSLSLFFWLFGTIIVAFACFAWVTLRYSEQQWNRNVLAGASRFSDLIQSSTHYSMLLNRKADVRHIIETVAREPGVEGVRIYDKLGTVVFSADRDEIGRAVDLQAEACVICHQAGRPLGKVPADTQARVYHDPTRGRVMGLIDPIENSRECAAAGCHAPVGEQTVLGVLDVKMSMAEADATLAALRRQIAVAGALLGLLAGVAAALLTYRNVHRPVHELIRGTRRVAGGDLDTVIRVERSNEIGQLAEAFNSMTGDLRRARAELTEWSDRLESRLLSRTEELNRTQRQVVHMEKMASLGKLAATVAHELNNPLAGILNYARLVDRSVGELDIREADRQELSRCLRLIQKEADRCGTTVRNLLLFARHSGAEPALVPLAPVIGRSLQLIRHHLEMSGIELVSRLFESGDDSIICDANQIEQAVVALLVNAVEAMPDGGRLTVAADGRASSVEIRITDEGCGIPREIQPQIFEPFFSTKSRAGGVGLGLSVAYGIVKRHGGEIDVQSEVGRGTTFVIELPRRPSPHDTQESHDGKRETESVG
ncbi:MAG TPA: ATP-binding protein [Candidatus Polarisedimenticolaceae bacterium]|nr:ATP-binding protein [Candidatus Polarisedimenticolaceae bacterium]